MSAASVVVLAALVSIGEGQSEIFPCDSDPCFNNATCFNLQVGVGFFCLCLPDLTGAQCMKDPCASNPCTPPSVCTDSNGGFLCLCQDSQYGDFCENQFAFIDTPPQRFNDPSGTIVSPNYPNPSPDGILSYFFIVQIPEARVIEFSFDQFCTELMKDFLYFGTGNTPSVASFPEQDNVTFLNGGQTIKNGVRVCDDDVPPPITITGHSAWFRYDTDQTVMSQGFSFSYTTNPNDCDPNPCQNGGVCDDLIRNYSCICLPGFVGKNCEMVTLPCESDPCLNGGTCLNIEQQNICRCPEGFTGQTCDIEINPCDSLPCQNGATCNSGTGLSYICTCPDGFNGANCNTEINPCDSLPCQNGATCSPGINLSFTCSCTDGFEGTTCDTEINPCDSNPCRSGATCFSFRGQFILCHCPRHLTGQFCEIEILPCESDPCLNGGTCFNIEGQNMCRCLEGFTGQTCDSEINPCDSLPCQNGATCKPGTGLSYTCTCPHGFVGKNCVLDPCASNPCTLPSVCARSEDDFLCLCQGYQYGDLCQDLFLFVDTPPERFIDPIGTILSPNYPNPSPDRLFSYFYIVQIPEARSIEFVFEEFCTEREKDFLYYGAGNTPSEVAFPLSEGIKVFHGWQTIENDTRRCDQNVPHPFTIAGDSAWFRFDTDQNVVSQGFNLSYTIYPDDCNPNPCQNGGICVDLIQNYFCICLPRFKGRHCQNESSLCPREPITVKAEGVLTRVEWNTSIIHITDIDQIIELTQESLMGSGDYFPVGTTEVMFRALDAVCKFQIIVEGGGIALDVTSPEVHDCPEAQLRFIVERDQNIIRPVWREPFATDDSCLPIVKESSHSPGDMFAEGDTKVTYNFTDRAGNQAQCIFNISVTGKNVTEDIPKFSFCPSSIRFFLPDSSNEANITWDEPKIEETSAISKTHSSGDSFEIGRTVVSYTILSPVGNSALCRFYVDVIDITPPKIFLCPSSKRVRLCRGSTTVFWTEPFSEDNSGLLVRNNQSHHPGVSVFSKGTIIVNYTFTDVFNNTSVCSFNITVHQDSCQRGLQDLHPIFVNTILGLVILVLVILVTINIWMYSYVGSTAQKRANDLNLRDTTIT